MTGLGWRLRRAFSDCKLVRIDDIRPASAPINVGFTSPMSNATSRPAKLPTIDAIAAEMKIGAGSAASYSPTAMP